MKYSAGLIPIDYRLLKEMTKEGTELAEFIPLGPSAKALAKRIDGITSNQVAGRVQVLEKLGYCIPIPLLPASQGRGWQRTAKADEFLRMVDDEGVMAALGKANENVNEPTEKFKGGRRPLVRSAEEQPDEPEEITDEQVEGWMRKEEDV